MADRERGDLLERSRRPVIWAGGGVTTAGASSELRELAERLGAPVVLTNNGRGNRPRDHPNHIGSMTEIPEAWEVLREADSMLAVGTRFQWAATSGGRHRSRRRSTSTSTRPSSGSTTAPRWRSWATRGPGCGTAGPDLAPFLTVAPNEGYRSYQIERDTAPGGDADPGQSFRTAQRSAEYLLGLRASLSPSGPGAARIRAAW